MNAPKKIILVECVSTAINYLDDICSLGYEPIILELAIEVAYLPFTHRDTSCEFLKKYNPKIIKANKDYAETLKLVKAEAPLLILPGSEISVEYATYLANDLGLISNPNEVLPQMTRKSEMHNALKNAGIRYINGKTVKCVAEAIEFWESIGRKQVVVKPTRRDGSVGLRLCSSKEDIEEAVCKCLQIEDMYGKCADEVLIQERILGTEYVVNTLLRDGKGYICSAYKYNKKTTPEGHVLYDNCESLSDLDPELAKYALQVNEAIGVQYGPVHGEFMIDDDGPVLIEVNCRICGGTMPKEFLDMIFGHHETDRSLEVYLNEEAFNSRLSEPYKIPGKGYIKELQVTEDIDIVDAPIVDVARSRKSYITHCNIDRHQNISLKKTVDLMTSGGRLFFANRDFDQLDNDMNYICDFCKNHYDQVYTLK